MVEQPRGRLVFVASIAGKIAPPEESAYAATKFAMLGLAESISIEVEKAGVHVLTVCPGAIRTPFFDEEALARLAPATTIGMVDRRGARRSDDRVRSRRASTRSPSRLTSRSPTSIQGIAPGFMRRAVRAQTRSTRSRSGR